MPPRVDLAWTPADATVDPSAAEQAILLRIREVIRSNLGDSEFHVPHLASAVAQSPRQLQRRLRQLTGLGPREFRRSERLAAAASLLRGGTLETVSEVAAAVGMSAPYLSRLYHARVGHPPSCDLHSHLAGRSA